MSTPNQGNPELPIEALSAAHQQNARQRHLLRYHEQVRVWLTATVLAAISFPAQQMSTSKELITLHICATLVASVILFFVWAYHVTLYKEERRKEWNNAVNRAQATLNPVSTAEGYTQVFGVYVETKRRSSQLITLGALVWAWAAIGAGTAIAQSSTNGLFEPVTLQLVLFALGLFLLGVVGSLFFQAAFVMGSSYLAGDVIVRHTLALALFATAQVSNLQEAKKQIEDDTEAFIAKSPWWFYPGSH
jgi:hypothetical protein